jgi:redox-sensitive bicupin YhaK (pirin superfamily)
MIAGGLFVTLASGIPGDDEALPIRAHARVLGVCLKAGETASYATARDRHLYLVAATGRSMAGEAAAGARDGPGINDLETFSMTTLEDSELVMVDSR